ncbi:ATP-binding protein [Belnapia moabensis]|uniref:ATP-binding protein n=1 Tax=Belnapia moabensis TaxID=365533 RepID=UPI0005BAF7D9|nr:sensor histidine kinase [Belnapia moabensis]
MLTNVLKHAFPEGRQGRILIRLALEGDGHMRLRIEDDGVGLPADRREGSLGLRLMEMFARQIQGSVRMEAGPGSRGTVVVTFPGPDAAKR